MNPTPPHLKTLEEIERECIPGLVEVLREEGIEAVRYALWDMTNGHRDYDPCIWRSRATEEQKRVGWEMAVRIFRSSVRCCVRPTDSRSRRRWTRSPRGLKASIKLLTDTKLPVSPVTT